ncbi:hypothetical protein [Algoriphagus zhangzhouensis]|uniref:Uncharacterized protein n=1 Tax=Algoriphagus zhangzhouensis TaxID=1073327 RepID=A0A1M7Z5X0_9BACT|nr:hypothetical protein [Algoriphagus zhangzhouensis]TDY48977.1 hypothetical protein A8938_0668 [Algoriphagus zhangzhouensis]SHO60244.1 hypothetical protein SAMN04488108_0668 [Algoriphagus zhangzhouensis]
MLNKLTAIIFILASNYIFVPTTIAQNLSEKLGAIETGFSFTTLGQSVNVIDQYLIKRAEKVVFRYVPDEVSAGLGYESYHLEITIKEKLEVSDADKKRERFHWSLNFFDSQGEVISTFIIAKEQVKYSGNQNESLNFYSIDLIDIPLNLLDRTHHIDLFYLR